MLISTVHFLLSPLAIRYSFFIRGCGGNAARIFFAVEMALLAASERSRWAPRYPFHQDLCQDKPPQALEMWSCAVSCLELCESADLRVSKQAAFAGELIQEV
ncbi:hypothetical protein PPTG_24937 [Phytophthora nicotianae INRA-310]|uniref:Uncharacterized protein n=2 Tax=Phytophthora nicotianae TaxID=4792 RepID=W2P8Y9_PHYN3|nr:hypothetical protein PPTG_24937 [Phytophthora nicotianae INRA-310]ETM97487.1 hypothetical protein PPTG_24937 [Phytophthora nicotianae INRA-310]